MAFIRMIPSAFDDDRLVGFVNVAWDGGAHAFILDTCVIPRMRRRGIAARMVVETTNVARARGASWLCRLQTAFEFILSELRIPTDHARPYQAQLI